MNIDARRARCRYLHAPKKYLNGQNKDRLYVSASIYFLHLAVSKLLYLVLQHIARPQDQPLGPGYHPDHWHNRPTIAANQVDGQYLMMGVEDERVRRVRHNVGERGDWGQADCLYMRFLALTECFYLVLADFLVIPTQTTDERGEGVGDVPQLTLLGAALHVNTNTVVPSPFSSTPTDASSTTSTTSLPELEDVVSPQSASRRYGRSCMDTMMFERESMGRFPMSPATAAAEGGGADGLGAQLRGVSPPSDHESQMEKEQAKEEEPTAAQEPELEPLVGEPESQSELQQLSSPSDPEPTPPSPTSKPPSPSSDDGTVAAALGEVMEGHVIQSMLERDHERREGESENAGQAGEQEAGEGLDTAPPNTTIQLFFSIPWTCPNTLSKWCRGSSPLGTSQQKSVCRKMLPSKSQYGKGAEADNTQLILVRQDCPNLGMGK
ncbi:hypothetical protein DFH08DRAFT_820910 [Mycena albidolilacea]|uniref:Uncharacterized protein n=1 Tax=Mycena albidolilacea TaxID=1033008 RepID=A0AAD6ZB10_9AGAR|nr:hypothetical protein DFH08DRAFT_820910 [Mycena albidolilacea]